MQPMGAKTMLGTVVNAYLFETEQKAAVAAVVEEPQRLADLLDRSQVVKLARGVDSIPEVDALEIVVTAVRDMDRRFGRDVPRLFELIGSGPCHIPEELDPSSAILKGADLRALLQLMREK